MAGSEGFLLFIFLGCFAIALAQPRVCVSNNLNAFVQRVPSVATTNCVDVVATWPLQSFSFPANYCDGVMKRSLPASIEELKREILEEVYRSLPVGNSNGIQSRQQKCIYNQNSFTPSVVNTLTCPMLNNVSSCLANATVIDTVVRSGLCALRSMGIAFNSDCWKAFAVDTCADFSLDVQSKQFYYSLRINGNVSTVVQNIPYCPSRCQQISSTCASVTPAPVCNSLCSSGLTPFTSGIAPAGYITCIYDCTPPPYTCPQNYNCQVAVPEDDDAKYGTAAGLLVFISHMLVALWLSF